MHPPLKHDWPDLLVSKLFVEHLAGCPNGNVEVLERLGHQMGHLSDLGVLWYPSRARDSRVAKDAKAHAMLRRNMTNVLKKIESMQDALQGRVWTSLHQRLTD